MRYVKAFVLDFRRIGNTDAVVLIRDGLLLPLYITTHFLLHVAFGFFYAVCKCAVVKLPIIYTYFGDT